MDGSFEKNYDIQNIYSNEYLLLYCRWICFQKFISKISLMFWRIINGSPNLPTFSSSQTFPLYTTIYWGFYFTPPTMVFLKNWYSSL